MRIFHIEYTLTAVLHHEPVELNAAAVKPAALLAVDVGPLRPLPLL